VGSEADPPRYGISVDRVALAESVQLLEHHTVACAAVAVVYRLGHDDRLRPAPDQLFHGFVLLDGSVWTLGDTHLVGRGHPLTVKGLFREMYDLRPSSLKVG
jgi:hypothetical protein